MASCGVLWHLVVFRQIPVRTASYLTGQLADTPTHRLPTHRLVLRTRQLATWSTRGQRRYEKTTPRSVD